MNLLRFKRAPGREAPLFGFCGAEPRVELEAMASTQTGATRPTVLIVDDDPIILQTTGAKLRSAGYDVVTASEGPEAISAVSERKPRFILLDIHLPPDVTNPHTSGWDGFRLMSWLRGLRNTQDARYFIISGNSSQELKDRARRSGAVGFFSKPIDHNELLAVLQNERCEELVSKEPRRWWTSLFGFL